MKYITAEQPPWIIEHLNGNDIAAVNQGGCASGAYMPAVTYHQAITTMGEHGDDVLDYLQDFSSELPTPPQDICWSGLAVFYLSRAVELFCAIHSDFADWENDEPMRGEA